MYKKFNINDDVRVKLTPRGREIYKNYCRKMVSYSPTIEPGFSRQLKKDKDGYTTWQLWYLMQIFGTHIGQGLDNCFDTNILIDEKYLS